MVRVPNGEISSKASSQPKSASCTGTTCQQPAGHHRGAAARTWLQPTDASLAGFLRSGLATWNYQTVIAGGRRIEVNYMTITDAGRRALDA
jgi:hypothetical protein